MASPSSPINNLLHLFGTLGFIAYFSTFQSCTYKFTHDNVHRLPLKKRVALEGIYDTSGSVVPHEIMWQELANEFSRSGYFYMAEPKKADYLIRVHLVQSQNAKVGGFYTPNEDDPEDPFLIDDLNPGALPPLNKSLDQPNTGERSQYQFQVEFWNLRNRQLIKQASYNVNFSHSYVIAQTGTTLSTLPLRSFENHNNQFRLSVKNLAADITSDFYTIF